MAVDPRRRRRLRLIEGVTLDGSGDRLVLGTVAGEVDLGPTSPGLAIVASRLADRDATPDSLADDVLRSDPRSELTSTYLLIGRLRRLGMLAETVVHGAIDLVTLEPTGRGPGRQQPLVPPGTTITLSRFASLRPEGSSWVLGSPLGHVRLAIHEGAVVRLLSALLQPVSAAAVVGTVLGPEADAAIIQALADAGALTAVDDRGAAEDGDARTGLWSEHDLSFHMRSRFGRHAGPFGAGFRHIGRFDPLPAVRALPPGPIVDLPRPDLTVVASADPGLTDVVEARRSRRPSTATALTLEQLGEFLFRAARVRWLDRMVVSGLGGETAEMEVTSRPYPSGGRSYELEIWLSVDRCEGLESGLYHYDPQGHRLVLVRARDGLVESLLEYATVAAGSGVPATLIHLAARFGRVSWKYDAIAYATIMKHVGVVYQTMYLVAEAMGLAACALGSGDSDRFAEAAGTDPLVESSVGDFMLSGPAADQRVGARPAMTRSSR